MFFIFVCRTPTNPKMGLLFVILSVIFMKGGVVRESEQPLLSKHHLHFAPNVLCICLLLFYRPHLEYSQEAAC